MKQLVLSQTDMLVYPLVAVVLFTAIFVGVLAWIARPGAKRVYKERSLMVFQDGGEQ